MRIIEATVTDARRCHDFGRVEARVTLSYQAFPGGPVETRTLLTSASADDPKGRDLRTRLVADAVRLARLAGASEPVAQAA